MAKNTPRVQICTPGANLHPGANFAHERGFKMLLFTQNKAYGRQQQWRRPRGKNELGDNCIQIFHLGRYIVGYTVGNYV